MKNNFFFITLLFAAFIISSCAGFRDLKFGTGYKDVEIKLTKESDRCGELRDYSSTDALQGLEEFYPQHNKKYICEPGYMIGDTKKPTIVFFSDGALSGVMVVLEKYEENLYKTYKKVLASKYDSYTTTTTEDIKIVKFNSGKGNSRIEQVEKFENGSVVLGVIKSSNGKQMFLSYTDSDKRQSELSQVTAEEL